MKKVFIMVMVSLCFGFTGLALWAGSAMADPPFVTDLQQQIDDLGAEDATLKRGLCNSINNSFSGADANPRFRDNCDGTVTDRDTGLMWEKKDSPGGGDSVCPGGPTCDNPHDVDNRYTWSSSGEDPDGPAFTDFLDKLNNGCNNDPSVDCTTGGDADCAVVGGCCGFACHRDWRVPEVGQDGGTAELETILFEPFTCTTSPCINPIFGPTATSFYWSAISTGDPELAFFIDFDVGFLGGFLKDSGGFHVRAVRDSP